MHFLCLYLTGENQGTRPLTGGQNFHLPGKDLENQHGMHFLVQICAGIRQNG